MKPEPGSALPIFNNFMREALANQPDIPFRIPAGIKLVRVNYENGKPAQPTDKSVILEALKPEFNFNSSEQRIIGTPAANENAGASEADIFVNDYDDNVQLGTQY